MKLIHIKPPFQTFYEEVVKFIKEMFKDPIGAIPSELLKSIGLHNGELRKKLYDYGIITKDERIDEPYDENIVYNFHCYSPLIFTHQGAYWIDKMDRSFRMPFNSKNSDYSKYTVEYIGKEYLDKFDEEGNIDSSYFENLFAEAIEIAKKRDVPLYCGEYGVIDLADAKDCLEWLKCISKVFDKYDIGRALWSYKEMDFGLVDAHYDDVREDMIGLL